MQGRLRALWLLLREADGLGECFRLAIALLGRALFAKALRRRQVSLEVKFKPFQLRFRLGQGELTPYFELLQMVVPGLFPPPPDLPSWTILDCGANIGLFSLFLKDARRIVAVEPNPDCFERLVGNFSRNRLRGTALNVAVGSAEGELRMFVCPTSTVTSSIREDGNVTVKCTTIDRLVAEQRLLLVDLLKLDLEGYEIEALEGARTSLSGRVFRRMFIEFLSDDALRRLDEHLAPFGFSRTATTDFNALYVLDEGPDQAAPAIASLS